MNLWPSFVCLFISILSASAHAQDWSLNAVSILLPNTATLLTAPEFSAYRGGYFEPSFVSEMGRFNLHSVSEGSYAPMDLLTLVGVRIDPCFRDHFFESCRPQLRAIWQVPTRSRLPTGVTQAKFHDGAVHTFHEYSPSEWNEILRAWTELNRPYARELADLPLQVHPVLAREGLQGAYGRRLSGILKQALRPATQVRTAFTILISVNFAWKMQIFDIQRGVFAQRTFPRSQFAPGTNDAFDNFGGMDSFKGFGNFFTDQDLDGEHYFRFVKDSTLPAWLKADESARLLNTMARVQNPGHHLPGTQDCLTCHLSQSATLMLENNLRKAGLFVPAPKDAYPRSAGLELTSRSVSNPNNLRMFGYIEGEPSIQSRVIFESNEVARLLSRISPL